MGDPDDVVSTSEMFKGTPVQVTWHLKGWNEYSEFLKDNAGCVVKIDSGSEADNAEEGQEETQKNSTVKLRFFFRDFERRSNKKWRLWYSLWVALLNPGQKQSPLTFQVEVTEEEEGNEDGAEEETGEDDDGEEDEDDDDEIEVKEQVTMRNSAETEEAVVVKEEFIPMSWWMINDNSEKIGNAHLTEWAEAEELHLKITVTTYSYSGSDILALADDDQGDDPEEAVVEPVEQIVPMIRDVKAMFTEEDNYSDVLLETRDGGVFNAHKFLLAARSSYLRGVLEKEVKKKGGFSGAIKLGNVDGRAMTVILYWMYTDEMHEDLGKVMDEVIKVAVKWELSDLIKMLDKKLITVCTTRNMLHMFQVAHKNGLFTAIEDISDFIKKNIDLVVPTRRADS